MTTVHTFEESLALSNSYTDASWWIPVYRAAFPDLEAAVCVRQDGWAQRGGIDRVLTLAGGKTLTVDEKVREEDWDDILLEYWSAEETKAPGWIAKSQACDFIAYAFVPSETCYLLPFQTLRRAWFLHRKQWVKDYRRVEAKNRPRNGRPYTTVSVPVPINVLMRCMNDAMCVKWSSEPTEEGVAGLA